MTTSDSEPSKSIELAAEIVAAFVANNSLPISELPALIHSVHAALTGVASGSASAAPSVEKKEPAVSIRKSITPDYLVCLDDGKKFKSLRRHLATLGLTPDEYRSKWGFAADYPMVAPNYAAQRSELAKRSGLGQLRKSAAAPAKKAASRRAAQTRKTGEGRRVIVDLTHGEARPTAGEAGWAGGLGVARIAETIRSCRRRRRRGVFVARQAAREG